MGLNEEKVQELLHEYFDGNVARFCRETGIDPAHFHRFMKTGKGGSKKFIDAISYFCKKKEIAFTDYFVI